MFNLTPIRSTIGIRRVRPHSSVPTEALDRPFVSLRGGFHGNPDKDEGKQKKEKDKNRELADHHSVPQSVLASSRWAIARPEAKPILRNRWDIRAEFSNR
jgi:hypothetical protein